MLDVGPRRSRGRLVIRDGAGTLLVHSVLSSVYLPRRLRATISVGTLVLASKNRNVARDDRVLHPVLTIQT